MKKLLGPLVGIGLLFCGTPAMANFVCDTNPSAYLGVDGSGWIAVQINGVGVQKVCSLSDTVGGVTAQACQGWYASLLTWRTQGRTGAFYYSPDNPANQGKTACTQFSEWDVGIPYFMQLN